MLLEVMKPYMNILFDPKVPFVAAERAGAARP
jgi:hypothetical protein